MSHDAIFEKRRDYELTDHSCLPAATTDKKADDSPLSDKDRQRHVDSILSSLENDYSADSFAKAVLTGDAIISSPEEFAKTADALSESARKGAPLSPITVVKDDNGHVTKIYGSQLDENFNRIELYDAS